MTSPSPFTSDLTPTQYRAVQATAPGKLELTTLPLKEPAARQVRARIEACGVCHSDALTVENLSAGLTYPRVPGHEIIGRIDALGEGVKDWTVGQRVGVGLRKDVPLLVEGRALDLGTFVVKAAGTAKLLLIEQRHLLTVSLPSMHRAAPVQENYLLGIALLSGFTDSAVPSCEIAQRLGWSRSRVCTMIRRLGAVDWLTHKPHRGICRLPQPAARPPQKKLSWKILLSLQYHSARRSMFDRRMIRTINSTGSWRTTCPAC